MTNASLLCASELRYNDPKGRPYIFSGWIHFNLQPICPKDQLSHF